MSSEVNKKCLYDLNNDRTLGMLGKPEDKPIKLINKMNKWLERAREIRYRVR